MTTLNILLAVESPFLGDLLSDGIRRQPDMAIVGEIGEVSNPLDLLLALHATEADVLVQSWAERQEAPDASCSHLFAQHPDLLLIGVPPNGTRAYMCQQTLRTTPLAISGLDQMLRGIRTSRADNGLTEDQSPQK